MSRHVLVMVVLIGLLLAGCVPASPVPQAGEATAVAPVAKSPSPTLVASAAELPGQTAAPTASPVPNPTVVATAGLPASPTAATPSVQYEGISFSYPATLARAAEGQIVPEEPGGADGPWWVPVPQHVEIGLAGYPLTNTFHAPRIIVYPVDDFAAINEQAAGQIAALRELLKTKPENPTGQLPFLPLFNAAQETHAGVKYLSFENGEGVRYLTQYAQGLMAVNNRDLFYTFQGITGDGKHYVAAILPMSLDGLPASGSELPADLKSMSSDDPEAVGKRFKQYVEETTAMLDARDARFTPSLADLDTLVTSLKVAPRVSPKATAGATPGGSSQGLSLSSDSETIRGRILQSYNSFETLWVDAMHTVYLPGGQPPAQSHQQVWIARPQRVRLLSAPAYAEPEQLVVLDGKAAITTNLRDGQSNQMPLTVSGAGPEALLATVVTAAGSPLVRQLLPIAFAEAGSTYRPVTMDQIAGRTALVVDYTPAPQEACFGGCNRARLWVDAETGILLGVLQYNGDTQEPAEYSVVNEIQLNPQIPDEYFAAPAKGQAPAFAPVTKGALDGLKAYQNVDGGFEFYIPEAWTVLGPDHNAAGSQTIMGPGPISWTSNEAPALQVTVASSDTMTVTQALTMLCGGGELPGPTETITLPTLLPVQRFQDPRSSGAECLLLSMYDNLVVLRIDHAKAGISAERLLQNFGPIDGTQPDGKPRPAAEQPGPVQVIASPEQGPRGTAFSFQFEGRPGQEIAYQVITPEGDPQTVARGTVVLDALGQAKAGPFTPAAGAPTGTYRVWVSAINGSLIGEVLFAVTE